MNKASGPSRISTEAWDATAMATNSVFSLFACLRYTRDPILRSGSFSGSPGTSRRMTSWDDIVLERLCWERKARRSGPA